MRRSIKQNLIAIVIAVALGLPSRVVPGIFPRWYVTYAGDFLWAMMVFFVLGLAFRSTRTVRVALCALCFSWLIEFSQIYHAEWIDSLRSIRPFALVLGSGFLWSDLLSYTLGIATGASIEHGISKYRSRGD